MASGQRRRTRPGSGRFSAISASRRPPVRSSATRAAARARSTAPGRSSRRRTGERPGSAESPPSGTGTLFGLGCTPTGICFSVGETYVSAPTVPPCSPTDNGDALPSTGAEVTLTSGSSPYTGMHEQAAARRRSRRTRSRIGVREPINTATGDLSETTTDLDRRPRRGRPAPVHADLRTRKSPRHNREDPPRR